MLRLLLAAAFVAAGSFKFGQQPDVVHAFGSTGLPGWFFYLIAGAEVLGGWRYWCRAWCGRRRGGYS
ncbi:MAG: DoxX family protein [Hymenobacter sp.]